jgi:hypothetical protein
MEDNWFVKEKKYLPNYLLVTAIPSLLFDLYFMSSGHLWDLYSTS